MNYQRVLALSTPSLPRSSLKRYLVRRIWAIAILITLLVVLLLGGNTVVVSSAKSSIKGTLVESGELVTQLHGSSKNNSPVAQLGLDYPAFQCRSNYMDGQQVNARLRYALVIDAGSTGTRIHIYSLVYCDGSKVVSLQNEIFHEIPKPLAAFTSHPQKISDELLLPLLSLAKRHVPPELYAETPLTLKATAGLRLLPGKDSSTLLTMIKIYFKQEQPFLYYDSFKNTEWVSIISGKEEGVWAWMTINFLLNKIGFLSHLNDPDMKDGFAPSENALASTVHTAAIMDLGGASTQLVFEVDHADQLYFSHQTNLTCSLQNERENCENLKAMLVPLEFGGKMYHLYQHSFLGFGLMEARKKIKASALLFSRNEPKDTVSFSCFPPTYGEQIQISDDTYLWLNGTSSNAVLNADRFTRAGEPTDNLDTCHSLVKSIFPMDAICTIPPCTFSGIHLPPSFHHVEHLFAFSYFYDRIEPHYPGHAQVTLEQVDSIRQKLCKSTFVKNSANVIENPYSCLDITFIRSLLMDAYGVPSSRQLSLGKKINGVETCWALGAAIDLLSQLDEK